MQKKRNIQIVVKIALLLLLPALHHAQIVIGSGPADGSAQLELQSTDKGALIPRLTTAQRDAIAAPAMGLMIYNTSTHCLEINLGTASVPYWGQMKCRTGMIAALNCGNTVVTGTLSPGQAASGVSASVPYTGGNEGVHAGQTVTSTGVTGLTATLAAGSFANGAGNLTYTITGTPSGTGAASFLIDIGGQWCTISIPVNIPGTISLLDCSPCSGTYTGTLVNGQATTGLSISVLYTGGNGGVHTGQTVTSAGVTGLTASLSAGNFATGTGNLTYNITGTPESAGTAYFALDIGGQMCTLNVNVLPAGTIVCSAKISPTIIKTFMCYNLGVANDSADPLTPSWEINGGYWQWGVSTQAAPGPTGSDSGQANSGLVSGWNTTGAADGSWTDGSKTANDPCPGGFRIPTRTQWSQLLQNNGRLNLGSFSASTTNYCSGVKFGDNLMLPVSGFRSNGDGSLFIRGNFGNYWSSTGSSFGNADYISFNNLNASISTAQRATGMSVRCIAE